VEEDEDRSRPRGVRSRGGDKIELNRRRNGMVNVRGTIHLGMISELWEELGEKDRNILALGEY
jgi:hypothetical protein